MCDHLLTFWMYFNDYFLFYCVSIQYWEQLSDLTEWKSIFLYLWNPQVWRHFLIRVLSWSPEFWCQCIQGYISLWSFEGRLFVASAVICRTSVDTETGRGCQDYDMEASMLKEEPLFCPELEPFIPLDCWPEIWCAARGQDQDIGYWECFCGKPCTKRNRNILVDYKEV